MNYSKLAELFEIKPYRWSLRGDPYLWDLMAERLKDNDIPETKDDLCKLISIEFEVLTGSSITKKGIIKVAKLSHGGMSSGMITGGFWSKTIVTYLWLLIEGKSREETRYLFWPNKAS
jgi:molybdenum cofactor cytidylyltransferase